MRQIDTLGCGAKNDGPGIDVFHSSMRHWDGDRSVIDGKTDERNTDDIIRALEWQGFKVEMVT